MVVFTCNHCGDAVQKPKVEKHYVVKCRRPKDLTCVDCLKDFRGEEFSVHTLCVSEDQRYSAKGTEQKPMKGMQKQGDWVDIIQSCYDTEPDCKKPKLQTVFKAVLGQTNIPRKKPKFMNFITSTMGNRVNKDDASEVFDLIQNYVKQQNMKAASVQNEEKLKKTVENCEKEDDSAAINGENETKKKKKTKKRKYSENGEVKLADIKKKIDQENILEEKPKEIKKTNKRKNKHSEVDDSKKPKLDNTASKEKQKNIPAGTEASKITSESESPTKKNKLKNKSNNDIPPVQSGVDGVKKAKKNNQNKIDTDNLVKTNDAGSSDVVQNRNDEAISSKSKKRRLKYKEKAQKKINDIENILKNDKEENATVEKTKERN